MTTKTRKQFKVTHTESTTAKSSAIWKIWSDVNNWPKWDDGLQSCELRGAFAAGSTFLLTPHGADGPIPVTIDELEQNRSFSDVTQLPFGALRTNHTAIESAGKTQVTHTVVAEIDEEKAGFFEENIWGHMREGLPSAVKNLVRLAEAV